MWQKFDAQRHFCHSWQDVAGRHDSAMAVFLLAALVVFVALTILRPSALGRTNDSPVHPSLRHLSNDRELHRN
jgi:hypothetical protein